MTEYSTSLNFRYLSLIQEIKPQQTLYQTANKRLEAELCDIISDSVLKEYIARPVKFYVTDIHLGPLRTLHILPACIQ